MATIRGTITQIGGDKPWFARYGDGQMIGTFADLRQAQIPIEASAGGYRLTWTLDEAQSEQCGEFWVGTDPR